VAVERPRLCLQQPPKGAKAAKAAKFDCWPSSGNGLAVFGGHERRRTPRAPTPPSGSLGDLRGVFGAVRRAPGPRRPGSLSAGCRNDRGIARLPRMPRLPSHFVGVLVACALAVSIVAQVPEGCWPTGRASVALSRKRLRASGNVGLPKRMWTGVQYSELSGQKLDGVCHWRAFMWTSLSEAQNRDSESRGHMRSKPRRGSSTETKATWSSGGRPWPAVGHSLGCRRCSADSARIAQDCGRGDRIVRAAKSRL
jgi:hypothetical protein